VTLRRLTPLDGEAILPLADAKKHLRVLEDTHDAVIEALRDAAVGHIERLSGIALAPASFRWSLRSFPCRIELPMRPVTGLDKTLYRDSDGAEQEYADAALIDGWAHPAITGSWPETNDLAAVEFTAGLESPSEAPELITAAKLMLTHFFENRGATTAMEVVQLPLGVADLIGSYRPMVA
jgi:uncharacterized phiE125 gp8 family phage protein